MSQVLGCSQRLRDVLHLLRGRATDARIESATQDSLDGHDVREAVSANFRRQQGLGVPLDYVHAQDGGSVALVEEVRAHDQAKQGLTGAFKYGPVLPDLSTTHPRRVPEANHPMVSISAADGYSLAAALSRSSV